MGFAIAQSDQAQKGRGYVSLRSTDRAKAAPLINQIFCTEKEDLGHPNPRNCAKAIEILPNLQPLNRIRKDASSLSWSSEWKEISPTSKNQ